MVKVMIGDTSNCKVADTAIAVACEADDANSGHGSAKGSLGRGLQAMIWPNAFGTLGWDGLFRAPIGLRFLCGA